MTTLRNARVSPEMCRTANAIATGAAIASRKQPRKIRRSHLPTDARVGRGCELMTGGFILAPRASGLGLRRFRRLFLGRAHRNVFERLDVKSFADGGQFLGTEVANNVHEHDLVA